MYKEKYKVLVETVFSRQEFQGAKVSASLSGEYGHIEYVEVLKRYLDVYVNESSKKILLDALENFLGPLIGFNLTVKLEEGVDTDENGDFTFEYNWRTAEITFWSGSDVKNVISPLPKIEYHRMDNSNNYNLANKISSVKLGFDGDRDFEKISANYFKWELVNEKIDLIMELDSCLSRHLEELHIIQNKIKLELLDNG